MQKIKLFNKCYERYCNNPSKETEKAYWKRRNKLVQEFQFKQGFENAKEIKKNNEIMYQFDDNKFNVPLFSFSLIYNDLQLNIPKGYALDYLDYVLENEGEKYLMQYADWYKFNGGR